VSAVGAMAGFWVALVYPSSAVDATFLGVAAVAGYALVTGLMVWISFRQGAVRPRVSLSERRSIVGIWTMLMALGMVFWVAYPLVCTGIVGAGSDRDDAFEMGIQGLLRGRFPDYVETYLGNSLSPLRGAFLLWWPFALLGAVAWQNLVWLAGYGLCALFFGVLGHRSSFRIGPGDARLLCRTGSLIAWQCPCQRSLKTDLSPAPPGMRFSGNRLSSFREPVFNGPFGLHRW
jgi:hypothetical protein